MFKKLCFVTAITTSPITCNGAELQGELEAGRFIEASQKFASDNSNQSKFVKAICQLASSLEVMQKGFYKYGLELNSNTAGIRGLAPVPHNPTPQEVDYAKIRKLLENFHTELHSMETTLEEIGAEDFHLPLDLTKIRFDVDSNNERTELESSIALFMRVQSNGLTRQQDNSSLSKFDGTIGFDRSDLIWLKGYVQVTLGVTDLVLAHDFEQSFNAFATHLFQNPKTAATDTDLESVQYDDIADAIAAIHLAKMNVIEPERLKKSRQHLINMVTCSKHMWQSILAETDDRNEWLPSPKQSSVTGVKITKPMIDQWHLFLDEVVSIALLVIS